MTMPMNEFNSNKAIYLQIGDEMIDRVLARTLEPDRRVPSVREYAAAVGVNVNTVVRAYEYLDSAGIIFNRRGLGYFVAPDARDKAVALRRADLIEGGTLDNIFRKLHVLGVDASDLASMYQKYIDNETTETEH